MNRRVFFLSGASLITLSACEIGLSEQETTFRKAYCNTLGIDGDFPILVDAHCHLLNAGDTDAAEFALRRQFNLDEQDRPLTESIFRSVINHATWRLPSIGLEKDRIRDYLAERTDADRINGGLENLCEDALNRHISPIARLEERGNLEGFLSSRIKNASDMMRNYANFDLFIPSMIDFVEGESGRDLIQEIRFYSMMNLATSGRFVPMVSFSPERQYLWEHTPHTESFGDGENLDVLGVVRVAIEELGFIGVKVHPSSGWAPFNNRKYGCLNTPNQIGDLDNQSESAAQTEYRFSKYDEYIRDLMLLCMRLDVPILTHCTTGIMANEKCMTGVRRDPSETDFTYNPKGDDWQKDGEIEWTGSPKQWTAAIDNLMDYIKNDPELSADESLSDKYPKLILAHLANAFKVPMPDTGAQWPKTPWLDYTTKKFSRYPGLHIDMSELSELISIADDEPTLYTGARSALRRFSNESGFRDRVLYGSDWHMPGVSGLGQSYPSLMWDAVTPTTRKDVFGANAVKLFGLNPGGVNRERLKKFYAAPPDKIFGRQNSDLTVRAAVDLENVPWWKKASDI